MSDIDFSRYHRQMLLPGFGEQGQRRICEATALVVGCGALGTVIANMLARAGVGHLVIVDRDFIEMTNLQRQVLFDEEDVAAGLPKAVAAERKLAKINSQVKVSAVVDDVNHTNIERLAGVKGDGSDDPDSPAGGKVDVILDGVDNFETRYLTNDVAVKHGIPYVYGGAVGTTGASYAILPHSAPPDVALADRGTAWEQAGYATPDLRDIFEQAPPPGMNPTCDTAGVLGSAVSIIANYQVAEALKILTRNWEAVCPTMLNIDLWGNRIRQFKVARAYEVSEGVASKQRKFEYLDGKFASGATTLCGRNAVQIARSVGDRGQGGKVDFEEIAGRLRAHGEVSANKFMLRADVVDNGKTYELTLFADGRAIVKGTKDQSVARGVYAKYVGA